MDFDTYLSARSGSLAAAILAAVVGPPSSSQRPSSASRSLAARHAPIRRRSSPAATPRSRVRRRKLRPIHGAFPGS
ncbi:hypothetical protein NL676_024492 [Syzygium grande]|nr:hypothetical protein NL676_024492 [Syzygium grande]